MRLRAASAPGTLYSIELDPNALTSGRTAHDCGRTHGMNPMSVLRMAQAMEANRAGFCWSDVSPRPLVGEEGQMGLSETVAAAVDPAVEMVEALVRRLWKRTRQQR